MMGEKFHVSKVVLDVRMKEKQQNAMVTMSAPTQFIAFPIFISPQETSDLKPMVVQPTDSGSFVPGGTNFVPPPPPSQFAPQPAVQNSYQSASSSVWNGQKQQQQQSFVTDSSGNKVITCQICTKRLSNEANLKRHIYSKHKVVGSTNFQCHDCGKFLSRADKLRKHQQTFHGRVFTTDEPPPAILTHFASSAASSSRAPAPATKKAQLQAQESQSDFRSKPRPFMCLVCGKRFTRKDHVQRHGTNVHKTYMPASLIKYIPSSSSGFPIATGMAKKCPALKPVLPHHQILAKKQAPSQQQILLMNMPPPERPRVSDYPTCSIVRGIVDELHEDRQRMAENGTSNASTAIIDEVVAKAAAAFSGNVDEDETENNDHQVCKLEI